MDLQQVSNAMAVWAAYLARLSAQQRSLAAQGQVIANHTTGSNVVPTPCMRGVVTTMLPLQTTTTHSLAS